MLSIIFINNSVSNIRWFISTLTNNEVALLGSLISSVATIVAAVGAVWLAFSQLRKQLEHKIIYEAWTDLQKKLYYLSQKLIDYDTKIQGIPYYLKTMTDNLVNGGNLHKYQLDKWNEFEDTLQSLQKAYIEYLISFESYEVILLPLNKMKETFSETFRTRIIDRHMEIAEKVFPQMYGIATGQSQVMSDKEINDYWYLITELSAFIDDFRKELQNVTLGKILKKNVIRREPEIECDILTRTGFIRHHPRDKKQ